MNNCQLSNVSEFNSIVGITEFSNFYKEQLSTGINFKGEGCQEKKTMKSLTRLVQHLILFKFSFFQTYLYRFFLSALNPFWLKEFKKFDHIFVKVTQSLNNQKTTI